MSAPTSAISGAASITTPPIRRVSPVACRPVTTCSTVSLCSAVKQTCKRKPSVASVIRQMKLAGVEIAGCEINPRDGTVMVVSGKPVPMQADDDHNEWDTVQ